MSQVQVSTGRENKTFLRWRYSKNEIQNIAPVVLSRSPKTRFSGEPRHLGPNGVPTSRNIVFFNRAQYIIGFQLLPCFLGNYLATFRSEKRDYRVSTSHTRKCFRFCRYTVFFFTPGNKTCVVSRAGVPKTPPNGFRFFRYTVFSPSR